MPFGSGVHGAELDRLARCLQDCATTGEALVTALMAERPGDPLVRRLIVSVATATTAATMVREAEEAAPDALRIHVEFTRDLVERLERDARQDGRLVAAAGASGVCLEASLEALQRGF